MKRYQFHVPETLLYAIEDYVAKSKFKNVACYLRYLIENNLPELKNNFAQEYLFDRRIDTGLFVNNFWKKFADDSFNWSAKHKIEYLKSWKGKINLQHERESDKEIIKLKGRLLKQINVQIKRYNLFIKKIKSGKSPAVAEVLSHIENEKI